LLKKTRHPLACFERAGWSPVAELFLFQAGRTLFLFHAGRTLFLFQAGRTRGTAREITVFFYPLLTHPTTKDSIDHAFYSYITNTQHFI
jgi:hypothetical protein